MKVLERLRSWWRGELADPHEIARAKRIEEERATRRVGAPPEAYTAARISHGGKESERGFS